MKKPMKTATLLALALVLFLSLAIAAYYRRGRGEHLGLGYLGYGHASSGDLRGTCGASCGALDPVNDPGYNVRDVIKNTLLLEEHLAEKRKYCKSCILKHFLINQGKLEEAVWMACDRCKEYPKLEDSVRFFDELFKQWYAGMDSEETRVDVLTQLRSWRREMVDLYYFKDTGVGMPE